MTLTDDFGACSQSLSKPFTVGAVPVPVPFDMNVSGKCGPPETVNFLDHTPGAVSWVWNFDYQPGYPNQQNTTKGGPANSTVYGGNQNYTILLTVTTNAAGCSASISRAGPGRFDADIEPIYPGIGYAASLRAADDQRPLASSARGKSRSYKLEFSGTARHRRRSSRRNTFSLPGNYQITLNWTDLNGCTGVSNTLYVNVGAPLNVDFTATSTTVCVGAEVDFGGPSLATDGAIFTSWDFWRRHPQKVFRRMAPRILITRPGVYTVTLYVANASGCQQTVTKTNYITVVASPTLAVSATNTCTGNRGVVMTF